MRPLVFLVASVLSCSVSAFAQQAPIATSPGDVPSRVDPQTTSDILARIQKSGADVGVAFRTLDRKIEWFSRADDVFHAASTMKIPVMIERFHQVREGKLKLDDSLPVKNEVHSLVDASIFALDPADDSETDLYNAAGKTAT